VHIPKSYKTCFDTILSSSNDLLHRIRKQCSMSRDPTWSNHSRCLFLERLNVYAATISCTRTPDVATGAPTIGVCRRASKFSCHAKGLICDILNLITIIGSAQYEPFPYHSPFLRYGPVSLLLNSTPNLKMFPLHQCLNYRGGLRGWTPNCFLNTPNTVSNYVQGGQIYYTVCSKKRIPSFIFGITSVLQHRF